jgi:type II secretory pathway pseudopilin PulG
VELLVVIAIIAVLAALLLPSLSRAKENARQAKCAANLRQIALGVFIYANEQEDTFPAQPGDGRPVRAAGGDGKNYYDLLMPDLDNPHVWDCPSAHLTAAGGVGYMSYHMNGLVITTNGLKTSAVTQPSFTLLMNDAGEKRRWDRAFLSTGSTRRLLVRPPHQQSQGRRKCRVRRWACDVVSRQPMEFQLLP